jgi:outer membrane protein assembly factor BamB
LPVSYERPTHSSDSPPSLSRWLDACELARGATIAVRQQATETSSVGIEGKEREGRCSHQAASHRDKLGGGKYARELTQKISESFMSNPFESPRSSEPESTGTIQPARRGRLIPPFSVRLIAAGFVLTAGIVRWFTITGDHAIVNILTFVCGLFACITIGLWFTFFSGYTRTTRFGTVMAVVGCIVLFFTAMRVEHVSGELVPTFQPRWAKKIDETLQPATPSDSGAAADLATATSDDFPQFLGPQRTGRVEHVKLGQDWNSNPPRQLWKQSIGAGWSAFSAANGFAVTQEQRGTDELVTCYEITSGKLVWSHATRTRHQTLPGGVGPRSTPAIHGGYVYALGATGEFVCLDGTNGKLVWRTNLLERYKVPPGTDELGVGWGRSNSPLVVDDLVIVPAGGPAAGPWVSLAAFHRKTGELAWEAGNQQVSFSSPTLATLAGKKQVVCIFEKSVAGHELETGKQLWSFDWPGNSTQDANVSQPMPIDEDKLLLSKGYSRGAALIRLAQKSPMEFSVDEVWRDPTILKTKFTNVVVYQGHAYGLSDGIMECVELATGRRQWKKGRYGQGQILGVADLILIQAESGEVAMVSATPSGFNELGRFQAIDGKTWNNLCLYGNRLLTRNSEEAACYELP